MLKAMGVYEDQPFVYEGYVTVAFLWAALIIYNLASYMLRNPLYGSVFIWVLLAINSELVTNKPQMTMIKYHVEDLLLIIQGISMVFLWTWLFVE
jgi:hypothetical protein